MSQQIWPSELADSQRVLLTTFSTDGTPWQHLCKAVPDGDGLGIVLRTSSPEAGHVRERRGVLVGACDSRGRPSGRQWSAEAFLCSAEMTVEYRIALINKYGLAEMLSLALARLREGLDGTTGVRLRPAGRRWPVLGPSWRPSSAYSPN